MSSFTLLGHNGAGKTTLINYMLGFFTDLSQHPFLPNFSKHFEKLELKSCGYAPEAAYIDNELSAQDYFNMIKRIRKSSDRLDTLLKKVHLQVDPKKPIKSYSKGMKQRFLLLLALVGNPKTVVLDEPTSGLDPFGSELISKTLLELNSRCNLIVSTHNIKLAFSLKNRVVILKEGKVVENRLFGSLEELEESLLRHKPKVLR